MYYSAVDYWTPTWTYPRSRLREPFPRRTRRMVLEFVPLSQASKGAAHAMSAGVNPRYTFSNRGAANRFIASDAGVSGR